jgi:hypothetical protein
MHVTKEQAIMLRDLGYKLKCRDYYNDRDGQLKTFTYRNYNDGNMTYSAPCIDEVVRWLREVWMWHIAALPLWVDKSIWKANVIDTRTLNTLKDSDFEGITCDEVTSMAITDTLKHITETRKSKTNA